MAVLDPPARFSQIFEEPLTEMVGELQERGFACALELGEEDDTLTVKEQYVRRILDNITSNLLKYADPAQDISVRFVKENGKAGLAFENAVLPGPSIGELSAKQTERFTLHKNSAACGKATGCAVFS